MREYGTHNNESELIKYVDWCRDWINRQENRNWVDDDHRETFEREKVGMNEDLDNLIETYVGSGRPPPSPDSNRTFHRLLSLASLNSRDEFTWGAWLDDDQDLTYAWDGDEDDDPRIPIGYGGDKLERSTLLHTSALLKHAYSEPPAPVVLGLSAVEQGDRTVYVGHAPACQIDAISSVPNMDPMMSSSFFAQLLYSGNMDQNQWQRVVDVRRIKDIANFIDNPENYIFNPVLLYVDKNQESGCVREKTKLNGAGELEVSFDFLINRREGWVDYVPKPGEGDTRPLKIVDGQHRVRGLAMSERGHELNIPFVLIVGEDPEIDRSLIAKIFTEINTKSVPIDPLHRLYLSYKFGMKGIGHSEDFSTEPDDRNTPTTNGRAQRRAYELALLLSSAPNSPLHDMIEFQRPTIKGRRRPYHICVNAVNWVASVRRWFTRGQVYSDWNTDEFHRQETTNFFEAFHTVCSLAWPNEPRWEPGRGRGKPLLQFEGPFLSLLELYPSLVQLIIEDSRVERPISKDVFIDYMKPLQNVDWLSPSILNSPLKGRTNTNIRHLVKWMMTAIKGREVCGEIEILSKELEYRSIPGKGILTVPAKVDIEFMSGIRWPGGQPVQVRITHPHHTLGSNWTIRWNTPTGPVEWDAKANAAVEQNRRGSELTITLDKVPPGADGLEIECSLHNANGSTLTEREQLSRSA